MGETFLVFTYIWQEGDVAKIVSAKGPAQNKSGQGNNMVSRHNYLLYHFLNNNSPHLASFFATKNFWKKKESARKNIHWTNY